MTVGLEVLGPSGLPVQYVGPQSTTIRYFDSRLLPIDSTGFYNMPGFETGNNTKGFFTPSFQLESSGFPGASANPFEVPDLDWTDANARMNYTDNVVPPGFNTGPRGLATRIRHYVYRGGTDGGTFGARFLDENGNTQISFENTLYQRSAGSTYRIGSTDPNMQYVVGGQEGIFPKFTEPPFPPFALFDEHLQIATSGFATKNVSGTNVRYPTGTMDLEDLVFFRMDQGIEYAATFWHEFAGYGGENGPFTCVATGTDAAVDYQIMSPRVPSYSPPEQHGLQLLNAAGTVVYDSRYPTLEIVYAEILSETQMRGVIENNDVINITLPVSIADPWVCTPFWTTFREGAINLDDTFYITVARPRLERINGTTLRVSRNRDISGNQYQFRKQGIQAAWIIVAREGA